jgi:hypothetical protein
VKAKGEVLFLSVVSRGILAMEWSSMIVLTFLFMPWGVPTSGLP